MHDFYTKNDNCIEVKNSIDSNFTNLIAKKSDSNISNVIIAMFVKIRRVTIIRICEIMHDFSIRKLIVRIHQDYQYAHFSFRYAHFSFRYAHSSFRCAHSSFSKKFSKLSSKIIRISFFIFDQSSISSYKTNFFVEDTQSFQ